MELERPNPAQVLTNYDAIVRRVHEERSKAMSEMLAGILRRTQASIRRRSSSRASP